MVVVSYSYYESWKKEYFHRLNFDNINNLNGISESPCANLEEKCLEGLDPPLENSGLYHIHIVE